MNMCRFILVVASCVVLVPVFAQELGGTVGSWTDPGKSVTQEIYLDLKKALVALKDGDLNAARSAALEPKLMKPILEMASDLVQIVPDADQQIALIGFPFPDGRALRDVFTLTGPFSVPEVRELTSPVNGAPPFQLEPDTAYYLFIGMTNEPAGDSATGSISVYRLQTPPIPMTEDAIIDEALPKILEWSRNDIGFRLHSITPAGERIKRALISQEEKAAKSPGE